MKGLHEQAAIARFDVDVAQRAQGHPAAGIEAVQHALPLAVVGQFMLERPEHFRFDRFELEIHLVAGAAAAFHPVASLALELAADQPPLLRQRMMGRGGDFRQRLALIPPGDDVAGTGDVDRRLVIATFDRAGAIDLKQLGMQGASK